MPCFQSCSELLVFKIVANENVIQARDITNQFGEFVVHENLDIDLRKGEVLGVVGASGTGKSVLLRTIVGLNQPRSGSINVFGNDVSKMTISEFRQLERRWGVLFQQGALFSSLSVSENIQVPLREHLKLRSPLIQNLAQMKLELVGLAASAADKLPSEISGGMRKRAGLARALALDPEILFLDEPTAGLDPIGAADFDQLILELKNSLGLSVFMVTHDLDSLSTVCDRIAVLADRKVLTVGTMEELMNYDHPWVQEYFHGPRGRAARA